MKNFALFPFLAILFLCKISLHAIEIDSIQIIKPKLDDSICFVKLVQHNNSNVLYGMVNDDNDYETPSIFYRISDENVEPIHSVKGSINDIAIINDVIYYIEHNTIQGYNISTGDTTERIIPSLAHYGRGLATIGDSVLVYIDNEWEQVYFFNIETHAETITPINDAFVLSPICYNKFKQQIVVGDKDRTIFSLDYPNLDVVGKHYLDDWFYNMQGGAFKSFTADKFGNIYVSKADTNGIYYLDTAHRIHKLCDYPKRPGKLFYNETENCLITTDLNDSSICKIYLGNSDNVSSLKNKNSHADLVVQIYPNPSYNTVNLAINSLELLNSKYSISNSEGRLVKRGVVHEKLLSFNNLETGIYHLNIVYNEIEISKTFVVY